MQYVMESALFGYDCLIHQSSAMVVNEQCSKLLKHYQQ